MGNGKLKELYKQISITRKITKTASDHMILLSIIPYLFIYWTNFHEFHKYGDCESKITTSMSQYTPCVAPFHSAINNNPVLFAEIYKYHCFYVLPWTYEQYSSVDI